MTATDTILGGVLTITALNVLIRSAQRKKKRLKKKEKTRRK